jgi:hypothetical protein
MGILGMKRGSALALGALACLLFAASADAAVYEGHFRGSPGSEIELTTKKERGKRYVRRIEYFAPTTCENGPSTLSSTEEFFGKDGKLDRHRRFVIQLDFIYSLRVAGAFKRGKGVGRFKARATFSPPTGVCKTGKLRWVARKG